MHHFREVTTLHHDIRKVLVSMFVQLRWRLAGYRNFPLKFATLVHPQASEEIRLAVAELLFKLNACCLDDHFSLKLRKMFVDARDMLKHIGLALTLKLWASVTKTTNMHLERMLARLRRAIDGAGCTCTGYRRMSI